MLNSPKRAANMTTGGLERYQSYLRNIFLTIYGRFATFAPPNSSSRMRKDSAKLIISLNTSATNSRQRPYHPSLSFQGDWEYDVESTIHDFLAHIKRFAEADTIEAQFKLLLPTKVSLDVRDEFLEDALDSCNAPRKRSILRDLVANGEENEFVSRPFYTEEDRGPIESWYWAHQRATPENFVFNPAMANLRKCGYVMRDSSRLDEWGVLKEPLDYRLNDGQVQRYYMEQKYLDERHAWKKRHRALHEKLTKMAVAKQVLPKMRYTGKKFLAARRIIRSSKAWAVRVGVEMDMPSGSFDIPLEETRRSHYLNQG
ncbi:hypothetical protein N7451_011549 [Penicillium sp. IBT 35674x]|nr:hypothetical protein N7451_011549 [Penicillium sp. IBT 35674x]